ncbi:MAG: signaling recognition particle receptor family protein, partial [Myxococcota bacterium]|nr:signaling recognition particle receptor family protein [Myxococcota bacterium]
VWCLPLTAWGQCTQSHSAQDLMADLQSSQVALSIDDPAGFIAAAEQLELWGKRVGAEVTRGEEGADPSSVVFDGLRSSLQRGADLVFVDTAGRLHTQTNLMDELKKVRKVMGKAIPGSPHEVLLVVDATTGQNAIQQAHTFHEATDVTGIVLTKLDGTAKGGVVIGVCDALSIPIRYIGVGERVSDLRPFDSEEFVEALFAP